MAQTITETAGLTAVPVAGKPGRLKVTLITPGQGSSGYYSPEVLEAAATDKVFPAGTQMYLDHPTESEQFERPERSVKDLGAVLVEDAYSEDGALVAEAESFSQHRELLSEMQQYIGVSVRSSADVSEGAGRRTIERLIASPSNSVDFVTRAGRGGSFTVLESARPSLVNRMALRHDGVSEATVNDQREALEAVIKDAYVGDKTWVWLRDFDATTAWFQVEDGDGTGTFQQNYTSSDDGVAISMDGERIEVRQSTTYVPVDPVGQSTTQESSGGHMAKIQIEESEHTRLTETAGRVTALESERDTAVKAKEAAESALESFKAEQKVAADAATVIDGVAKEAEVTFTPLEVVGLKAALPIKEGALDVEAFTTTVANEAAAIAKSGRVTGLGATQTEQIGEADFASAVAGAFGRQVKEA